MKIALLAFPVMDWGPTGHLRPIGMDMHRECPPLSLYGLREVCLAEGHEVVICDFVGLGRLLTWPDISEIADADLIGITATSLSFPAALDGYGKIRQALPEASIVFGGPHPTLFDRYLIEQHNADFVVRGEGEQALIELCRHLSGGCEITDVPNLTYRDTEGKARRNRQGRKITRSDFDAIPSPNYSDLPDRAYQSLSIESSRGCPFDCSFCSTNYRKSYRAQTPQSFVDRLEFIKPFLGRTRCGFTHIVDDEFTMNQKRVIEICKEIEQRDINMQLAFDARANDLVDEALITNLAPHTLEFLVGAECGYDEGLDKIGKGTTCASLKAAAQMLARHGIAEKAHFSFIIGLPWENEEEIKRTLSFASFLCGEYGVKILLQWYCQIPGSRTWQEARERGLVSPRMYDDFGFFRDRHLFFSAVNVSPSQVWEISDVIECIRWTLKLRHTRTDPLDYSVPGAVSQYFPRSDYSTSDFGTLVEAVAYRGREERL